MSCQSTVLDQACCPMQAADLRRLRRSTYKCAAAPAERVPELAARPLPRRDTPHDGHLPAWHFPPLPWTSCSEMICSCMSWIRVTHRLHGIFTLACQASSVGFIAIWPCRDTALYEGYCADRSACLCIQKGLLSRYLLQSLTACRSWRLVLSSNSLEELANCPMVARRADRYSAFFAAAPEMLQVDTLRGRL